MEKYESKQVRIVRSAEMIYTVLSDFSNLSPILKDKVEDWQATADSCSFKVKGFAVKLHMLEREPYKLIKVGADKESPIDFSFWLQLQSVAEDDTRMRLVLHLDLNMMMKMMIGGKIQDAIDQIAEQIATSFNNAPI